MNTGEDDRKVATGDPGAETLTNEEIRAITSRFELSHPLTFRPFLRGSRRAPKAVITNDDGTELLLKRRAPERSDRSRVQFSHTLQQALVRAGIPAVAPLPDRSGETLIEHDGHVYELFPYLPGRRPERNEANAVKSGEMLAVMHEAVHPDDLGTLPEPTSYHGVKDLQRLAPILQQRLGTDAGRRLRTREIVRYLLRAYEDSGRRAESAGVGETPDAVLHGDWHPGNLLVHEDRITGILDFESARVEPRIMEVANAALQFAHEPVIDAKNPATWPVHLSVHRVRALISGYDAVATRPLSKGERAGIAWLIIEALIHEAMLPVAATGRFGDLDGLDFLELIGRRTQWLRPRAAKATEGFMS